MVTVEHVVDAEVDCDRGHMSNSMKERMLTATVGERCCWQWVLLHPYDDMVSQTVCGGGGGHHGIWSCFQVMLPNAVVWHELHPGAQAQHTGASIQVLMCYGA
jgi:hypothetical protein